MDLKKDRDYYISLLQKKAEETGRMPKKSDFSTGDMSMIKSFWGPWPHALAAAGLTEYKEEKRLEKNREKRQRAKENRKNNS